MSTNREFKGTKGKWEVVKNKSFFKVNSNGDKNSMRCNVMLFSKDFEINLHLTKENEANARVISQSPNLLDKLIKSKDLLNLLIGDYGIELTEEEESLIDDIELAISKSL